MQILLDTDTASIIELAAAVNMLDDILVARRTERDKEPAPAANEEKSALPKFTGALTTVADVVSENDVEVEIDADGNIMSLTTSTELPSQAPPAPPAPPPPPTSAPLPPQTPAPPGPTVAAELDSRGMPWDSRIHAANRAQNIDKSWKKKRGIDAATVTAYEAQNKPGNAAPAAATTIPNETAVVSSAGTTPPSVPSPPPPPPPAVPLAPAAPSGATSSVPPATEPVAVDFLGLMKKIAKLTAEAKLTVNQVNGAMATVGLKPEEMSQLINNALLIASVNAAIDKCLGS